MFTQSMNLVLASSAINWADITAILGVISALGLAFVGIRKLGPEKDSIYITSAQGAAVIMEGLVSTLRQELERERQKSEELEADVRRLEIENDHLREHGERRGQSTQGN